MERSWAPLSFAQWIVFELLCYCRCLLDELTFKVNWSNYLSKNSK